MMGGSVILLAVGEVSLSGDWVCGVSVCGEGEGMGGSSGDGAVDGPPLPLPPGRGWAMVGSLAPPDLLSRDFCPPPLCRDLLPLGSLVGRSTITKSSESER